MATVTGITSARAAEIDAAAAAAAQSATDARAKLDHFWVDVKSDYGAVGDNATDDYAAIQAAIDNADDYATIYFPPGKYRVSQPIQMRDWKTLRGPLPGHSTYNQAYIKPIVGGVFGGGAIRGLIEAPDRTQWQICDLNLDGDSILGTTSVPINGIYAMGSAKGARISNVWINNFSAYGVRTDTGQFGYPSGWQVSNLNISNCDQGGWYSTNTYGVVGVNPFNVSLGDMQFSACEIVSNAGDGFSAKGILFSDFVNVRIMRNVGHGVYLNGYSSQVGFTACQTDRNTKNGIYLHAVDSTPAATPAPHSIAIVGCNLNRDGWNNDSTQAGYAGIRIEGDSASVQHCPVTITGCNIRADRRDDGGGLVAPDYSVYVTQGRKVLIDGCLLSATVAMIFDDTDAVIAGLANSYTLITTGGVVTYDAPVGGWAMKAYRVKTADQAKNNTVTMADCTGLGIPVQPGATYEMSSGLIYDASITADMKIGWTGPAGATMDWAPFAAGLGRAAGAGTSAPDMDQRGLGTIGQLGGANVGVKLFAAPKGRLVVGATAGILQLQFALNFAEATNATIYAGSWLKLERIS